MNKPAGDEHLGKFVYCQQHLRVHATGWCTVSERDKVPLHGDTIQEAVRQAKDLGLIEE